MLVCVKHTRMSVCLQNDCFDLSYRRQMNMMPGGGDFWDIRWISVHSNDPLLLASGSFLSIITRRSFDKFVLAYIFCLHLIANTETLKKSAHC